MEKKTTLLIMILTKTPFRISLIGGGSDLPSFYKNYGGAVISMSIDKYIYISLHKKFSKGYRISYSETENCHTLEQIKHDIVRESIRYSEIIDDLEITSIADIPAGSGLGSSSSYAVGLAQALLKYKNGAFSKEKLADIACNIEINILNKPIGKQDQYAAAFGGLNLLEFNKNETVSVHPLTLNHNIQEKMLGRFLMFHTGGLRSADDILKQQVFNLENDKKHSDLTRSLVGLTYELYNQLQNNNINDIGNILDKGWQIKKNLSSNISNDYINNLYDKAIDAGAEGGKLLGAGSAGFILLYANKKFHTSIRNALGLHEVQFKLDKLGSQIIYCNN
jgi:D-glycero-alpha-D-manno-heptose-7-phosphate kinase